jgi:hypothetical protein
MNSPSSYIWSMDSSLLLPPKRIGSKNLQSIVERTIVFWFPNTSIKILNTCDTCDTCDTSLHFATLRYTSLHFAILCYTSLHFATLRYTSLHFATLRYTSLHFATLRYTSLHFATLRYTLERSRKDYSSLGYGSKESTATTTTSNAMNSKLAPYLVLTTHFPLLMREVVQHSWGSQK